MRHANYPDETGVGVPPPSDEAKRAHAAGRCALCVDREAKCWGCATVVNAVEEHLTYLRGIK